MTFSSPCVTQSRQGATAIVGFAHAPLHTIDNKGADLIADALDRAFQDDGVQAVALHGAGDGVFIRHADVAQIARAAEALANRRIAPGSFLDSPFARLTRMLDDAPKPVIAAIDGTCMGGGLEIAIACTMRIAGEAVNHIGLPEIRLGIFPGCGGTQRLARLIGWQRARLVALQGEVMDSRTALAAGLVDEVCQDPLARALEIARSFEGREQAATSAILRLTRSRDLASGLEEELLAFAGLLRDHPTVREGLRSFVERGERLEELC